MSFEASSYVSDVETNQSFWGWDGLWTPLIETTQTRGSYSILEQWLTNQAGPPPHVHEQGDEVFYILDGEVRLQIDSDVIDAHPGQLVRVPPGTTHGFVVMSDSARFLNFYVPAALDLMISSLSNKARSNRLPSVSEQSPASDEARSAFRDRLEELATQTWVDAPDLLEQFRSSDAGNKPGGPASSD